MKAILAALIATTGLIASTAQAATINVNTTEECAPTGCLTSVDNKCSLGEAIITINNGFDTKDCKNASTDTYGNNDTINLIAGATFNFTVADHQFPVGPTALPIIRKSVTIHGHGAKLTHEENDNGFVAPLRFFEITSQVDDEPTDFNDPLGPQIQVFWDETTFDGGDPDCFCPINEIPVVADKLIETQAVACLPASAGDQCYSGGAGYVRGSGIHTTFDKTTFKNNAVRTTFAYEGPLGGAVFLDNGAFGLANFSRSLFLSNKAPAGGAIYAGVGTQLSVTESTFAGNKAQVERDTSLDDELDPDPVIDALDTADSKMGGAIYAEGPVVSVNNSAFYSNQGGVGGALALRGTTSSVLNSTFFKNSAELLGGAIATAAIPFNYRDLNGPPIPNSSSSNFSDFAFSALIQSPTVTIDHVTMVENRVGQGSAEVSAVSAGGGIANLGAGTIALRHSIIANNTAVGGASGANCYGNFISLGQNDLHWPNFDPSCVITQAAGSEPDHHEDPLLKKCNEDLVNAGKASCDPEPTSPMIDGAISCPAEDQHHDVRNPEICTVGAIEYAKTCDDGVTHEGEDCPTPTKPEGSICGNGIVETGEQCDDGEAGNSNEPNATCRTDCRTQRCGDGIVDTDAGEVCDSDVTCFECQAVVTPSGACAITEEDLLDPSLKTNDDLIERFGFDAVSKCLNVFGGASSCSLASGPMTGNDWGTLLTFAAGVLPLIWRRNK